MNWIRVDQADWSLDMEVSSFRLFFSILSKKMIKQFAKCDIE